MSYILNRGTSVTERQGKWLLATASYSIIRHALNPSDAHAAAAGHSTVEPTPPSFVVTRELTRSLWFTIIPR